MTELFIVCEGLTEVGFVRQLLKPHLEVGEPGRLAVKAPNLKGYKTYAQLRKYIKSLLGSRGRQVAITTMIDLFKAPRDFPGIAERDEEEPAKRVERLERACNDDIGDGRFFAYLQLHEFEALMLADLMLLVDLHPNRHREIGILAKRLKKDFASPEHVDGMEPPSRRIKKAVPEYGKPVDGVSTTSKIGLSKLRETCPHFGSWLRRLEGLG